MFKFLIKSFNGLFTAYQNTHALTSSLSWAGFLRKPGSVGCAAASLPSSLGLSSSGFMAGQRHFCGKIMTVSQHCGCKKLEQLQEEPSHRHKKASSGAGPQPADKSAEASRRVDHGFSELLDFFQILFFHLMLLTSAVIFTVVQCRKGFGWVWCIQRRSWAAPSCTASRLALSPGSQAPGGWMFSGPFHSLSLHVFALV